jgi:hypothetical protein
MHKKVPILRLSLLYVYVYLTGSGLICSSCRPRSADSGLLHLWTSSKDPADEMNSEGRHNNQLHCVPMCGSAGLVEICSSNCTAPMQM